VTEFRVPARMKGEGRLLIVLAFGLIGFAAYFAVGVVRGRLSAIHLVIAVLSVLVAGLTIWSQQRVPAVLRATPDRLVVSRATYPWDGVKDVELSTKDGHTTLTVTFTEKGEPPVQVPLDGAALPPLEVLHGIRQVAPDRVAARVT